MRSTLSPSQALGFDARERGDALDENPSRPRRDRPLARLSRARARIHPRRRSQQRPVGRSSERVERRRRRRRQRPRGGHHRAFRPSRSPSVAARDDDAVDRAREDVLEAMEDRVRDVV